MIQKTHQTPIIDAYMQRAASLLPRDVPQKTVQGSSLISLVFEVLGFDFVLKLILLETNTKDYCD